MNGIPVLFVPEDWTPAHWLSISRIRALVKEGVGIYLREGLPVGFDLGWLGQEIEVLPLLWMDAGPGEIEGLSVLNQAAGLRELMTPLAGEVDLSSLPSLREVEVRSDGYLSALRSPSVSTVILRTPRVSAEIALSTSISSLSITSPSVDSKIFTKLPLLRLLGLYDARIVDLRHLPDNAPIEELVVADCNVLRGVASLTRFDVLKTVKLFRVSRILDVGHIADLRVSSLEIFDCPDITSEVAQRLASLQPTWTVASSQRRLSRSRFDLVEAHDGTHEIVFNDWEWINSLIKRGHINTKIFVDELEKAFIAAVAVDRPLTVDFHFDSEAGSVIAITSSRSDALRLRRRWDAAIATSESLRSVLVSAEILPPA
ncbi:hypothetical protein M3667_10960 [Microbacterium sp. P26]|nr:hypothetical protein [Microbacterium sp. P26]